MFSILKEKNFLNDAFSEFRKYIAPTYYHDRCERSLNMHLYTMHKRDFLLILAGFLATFIFLLFIGLAGPNVNVLSSIRAQKIFNLTQVNESFRSNLLENGSFILTTPQISTYSDHVCLWITLFLEKEDDTEDFHKEFFIFLRITARDELYSDKEILILNEDLKTTSLRNKKIEHLNKENFGRKHKLSCIGKKCNPIEILHLDYLQYNSYSIEIHFQDLSSVNEKYIIRDILFTFQSINPSFTNLTIWFRFFFLALSFLVMCWFTYCLHKYNFNEWSIEQKWISVLLILLIFYDNPFYPMVYLFGSKFPRIIEIIFQNNFFLCLLLFWLVFYHGIRQNNRSITKFYGPKILIVALLWFIIIYSLNWSAIQKLENPTIDEQLVFETSFFFKILKFVFYLLFIVYFFYLLLLILTAFTELRSMPYFDLRLKLQTSLIIFVLFISVLITLLNSSNNPREIGGSVVSRIPYLQILPWTFKNSSSASFLTIYSLVNLYVYICTYFYAPTFSSFIDSRVIRDNPTLSMVNDSDEDVIYGLDIDEPRSRTKLIESKENLNESD